MRNVLKLCLLLFGSLLILPSFNAGEGGSKIKIPRKVNSIIQDKCYGCHSNEGKNQRPKDKLNWDTLNALSKEDQAKKIHEIQEVLKEGSMPPQRFLEKMPEKKLTDKESAAMQKWADKTAKKLSK